MITNHNINKLQIKMLAKTQTKLTINRGERRETEREAEAETETKPATDC